MNNTDTQSRKNGAHMPEKQEIVTLARLDHVTDQGDLVFVADHRRFAVRIDDALQHAMMEGEQIRADIDGIRQPRPAAALPISAIQSLIRAGAESATVARQFSVSEALVRRFAAPVETERKYAVDQFLAAPADRQATSHSRSRTIADLIEESLRTSRIGLNALAWSATRRDHEPWRLKARFDSAGRTITAEWSWDVHDNTVVCINAVAKRLLGKAAGVAPGLFAGGQDAGEVSTAALNGRGPLPFDWMEHEVAGTEHPTSPADGQAASQDALPRGVPTAGASRSNAPASGTGAADADTDTTDGTPSNAGAQTSERHPDPASGSGKSRSRGASQQSKNSKRSAVPSWDEILFGD